MPGIAFKLVYYGCRVRPELRIEGIGIGLIYKLAIMSIYCVFIKIANVRRAYMRLPYARGGAGAHHIRINVPIIKAAYYAYA